MQIWNADVIKISDDLYLIAISIINMVSSKVSGQVLCLNIGFLPDLSISNLTISESKLRL